MTISWEILPAKNFAETATNWDELNESNFKSPLLESRFIGPAINIFGNGSQIIALGRINGLVVAMGVFEKNRFGSWSTFQPSQAPIGLWLATPGIDLEQSLDSLARKLPGACFLLSILQQDSQLFEEPIEHSKVATMDYIDTASIRLDTCFDDYWQLRSKNTRKSVRKQRNKLNEQQLITRLEVLTGADHVSGALMRYGELESAGWKAEKNTAIHTDNNQGFFYTQVLENFCATGDGIIFQQWFGDRVVAMDLCVANDESLVILKTAYDEKAGEYSPALLMHAAIFEHLFKEQKYHSIEFYGRVMDWHLKWSKDSRKLYHINYFTHSRIKTMNNLYRGLNAS